MKVLIHQKAHLSLEDIKKLSDTLTEKEKQQIGNTVYTTIILNISDNV